MSEQIAPFITIVSGLPRSGTSMMMQMIAAGGIQPLTDEIRTPDEDNPKGYFELERVKTIKSDKSWLPQAVGRVVKLIHLLLLELPGDQTYRVVFMRRDLDEVTTSQATMLARSGKAGAALPAAILKKTYQQQLDRVLGWLGDQPNFDVLEVRYAEVVTDPKPQADQINTFLGGSLDALAMAAVVDPSLYRNRN